jgi:2-polyprenyl-3-methyl-5-hydroxy-6-metoxy-1,4-benzoquinol methylase
MTMTPHGLALMAYFEGQISAEITVRRDDGFEASLPAKHFFRTAAEFSPVEISALKLCRGYILDIGAGSGIHSLALQSKELTVTAIDISPEAIEIMTRRGVKDTQQADMLTFRGGPFDTLLMLGHGIGITGDLEGLDKFLNHAHKLMKSDGQILLDSLDVSKSADENNLSYHDANRRTGRYIGETLIQMEYLGIKGPFFGWLHVDLLTLKEHARQAGWTSEVILEEESGEYLARLVQVK